MTLTRSDAEATGDVTPVEKVTVPFFACALSCDHIDHAVKVAGIDHVAVSSDNEPVEDLEDRSKWPNLTKGLVKRGYSDGDIRKILGENFLRVWDQAAGTSDVS